KLDPCVLTTDRTILTIGSLTLAGNGKVDVGNNQLMLTSPAATVRGQIIAQTLFSTTAGGVLGYADLGGGTTEVRFTLKGDANLAGKVNVGALGALAPNYGATGGAVWTQGDFDYNDAVNVGALGALATTSGAGLAGAPAVEPLATAASSAA